MYNLNLKYHTNIQNGGHNGTPSIKYKMIQFQPSFQDTMWNLVSNIYAHISDRNIHTK